MSVSEATRTLVKSAPELWAEISDPAALARHLEEFGEIKITRSEPERTVAWEGERASGTVELEVSGWGTKVRLTAQVAEAESGPAPPAMAAPEPLYKLAEPEPPAEPEPELKPAAAPRAPAAAAPPRRRFFSRMFSGKAAAVRAPARESSATAAAQAPPQPAPRPPVPAVPPPSRMQPTAVSLGRIRVLELSRPEANDPAIALESVLDVLGTAHRRPFSRG